MSRAGVRWYRTRTEAPKCTVGHRLCKTSMESYDRPSRAKSRCNNHIKRNVQIQTAALGTAVAHSGRSTHSKIFMHELQIVLLRSFECINGCGTLCHVVVILIVLIQITKPLLRLRTVCAWKCIKERSNYDSADLLCRRRKGLFAVPEDGECRRS